MQRIGIIPNDRLINIPKSSWAHHEFCFHLHDLILGLLLQMEQQKAGLVKFEIASDEEKNLLSSDIHILDFLEATGRGDVERRAVINHVCNALYADMLHFIHDGLRALEKRKFSVALSLLRKPFKESLIIAALMCDDEENFFKTMKYDAKNLLNKKIMDEMAVKKLFSDVVSNTEGAKFTNSDRIWDISFNFKNEYGLASLFDKATHLVTEFRRNQTENYNLNLIFKNPLDNDLYSGSIYQQISIILLFLHIMQIELYSRMREPSKTYKNWLLITSLGAFETLFSPGRSRMTKFVNSNFGTFMKCPVCQGTLKLKKRDAPRLFIGERISCPKCRTDQHFPFGWLLSQVDVDIMKHI